MFFEQIHEAQADPVFGLVGAFRGDVRPQKVDLMVGIYKDENLQSDLFPSVRKAKELIGIQDVKADYLPIDGLAEWGDLLGAVVFGETNWKEVRERTYTAQTVGGTGALRVGGELLAQEISKKICISNQTWPNHHSIFGRIGMKVESYPYYDRSKKGLDIDGMLSFLEQLDEKTVVLLHACCHNPTGCDLDEPQWKTISHTMQKKQLIPFFDFAYQGIGEGLEKDATAVRQFVKDGHEMLVAYSCSKNFSMYGQRVGALFVVNQSPATAKKVGSQVKKIIRALYSNPPAHGARIVAEVLKKEELKRLWQKDLEEVRHRIYLMRESFIQRLIHGSKKVDYSYLRSDRGMFSLLNLDPSQVRKLIDQFAVYLLDNGRLSLPGLTSRNLDYVVHSILSV